MYIAFTTYQAQFWALNFTLKWPYKVDAIIFPILQAGQLNLRDFKLFAQGHKIYSGKVRICTQIIWL